MKQLAFALLLSAAIASCGGNETKERLTLREAAEKAGIDTSHIPEGDSTPDSSPSERSVENSPEGRRGRGYLDPNLSAEGGPFIEYDPSENPECSLVQNTPVLAEVVHVISLRDSDGIVYGCLNFSENPTYENRPYGAAYGAVNEKYGRFEFMELIDRSETPLVPSLDDGTVSYMLSLIAEEWAQEVNNNFSGGTPVFLKVGQGDTLFSPVLRESGNEAPSAIIKAKMLSSEGNLLGWSYVRATYEADTDRIIAMLSIRWQEEPPVEDHFLANLILR